MATPDHRFGQMNECDRGEDPISRYNTRLGLVLFAVYVLLYAGFVGLCAFSPKTLALDALAGVNVAIVYGMALILGAFLMALLYMFLCKSHKVNV